MMLFGLIKFQFYRNHLKIVTEAGQRVRGSSCDFLHGQGLASGGIDRVSISFNLREVIKLKSEIHAEYFNSLWVMEMKPS